MHLNLNSRAVGCKMIVAVVAQAVLASSGFAFGFTITAPNGLFNMGGNSASELPFDTGTNSIRYQQVFDASQFGRIGPGGALVTTLAFRVAASGQGFDTTLPSIRIDLSTTAKAPYALSPTFAENVGEDDAIVFGTGPLSIRAGGFVGPGAWDVLVPLARPFFYNPAAGNLLLDVRNFGGGSTTYLDAQVTLGDSVSAVQAYTGDGSGSVNSTTGLPHTGGLITLFEVTPVPEPASISVLLLAICATALVRLLCKHG